MSARELPSDVEALKALVLDERARVIERDRVIAQRDSEIAQRDDEIARHKQSIAALEHKLHVWGKWIFGSRTEKRVAPSVLPAGQSWLPFADLLADAQRLADRHGVHGSVEVEVPAESQAKPKPRAKRRAEFPEHLPRIRTTIEVPEADRMCCGRPMQPMGVELSKELERIETAVVHEIARTKYCCRTCQMQVLTAPAPLRPLPKALLGANWLASLAVERFGHHMPYYRLEKKYESEGLALSRTVLCRSMIELAKSFEPVYRALGDEVTSSDVAFADETSAKVQASKAGGPGKSWVWLYANKDGDCFYDYCESRGRDSPTRVLSHFKGSLHDDGYCVYEVALDPTKVAHVACWAHVRRKYDEARDTDAVLAQEALDWIAKLYAIDGAAKEQKLTSDQLGELRREHAPAILEGFKRWLEVRQTQVLPESPMGKAIRYTLGRWEALCRFLEDGRFELDNNRAERALRAVAVGRKNWVQFGNENGGRAAAVFFSLIATCKERGIDPKLYLHDAALHLAERADPKHLTPREWQARYSAEAAARRSYVLAQMLSKLDA
jgi:transposase